MQEGKKQLTLREQLIMMMMNKMAADQPNIVQVWAQAAGMGLLVGLMVFIVCNFTSNNEFIPDSWHRGPITGVSVFLLWLYYDQSRIQRWFFRKMRESLLKLEHTKIENWFKLEKHTVQYFRHTLYLKDCWDQEHVITIEVNAKRTSADQYFWDKVEEDFELRRSQQGFPPPHWQTAVA